MKPIKEMPIGKASFPHGLGGATDKSCVTLKELDEAPLVSGDCQSETWKDEKDAKIAAMDMAVNVVQGEVNALRDALQAARPIVKHAAIDGSEEASAVLDQIERALGNTD